MQRGNLKNDVMIVSSFLASQKQKKEIENNNNQFYSYNKPIERGWN